MRIRLTPFTVPAILAACVQVGCGGSTPTTALETTTPVNTIPGSTTPGTGGAVCFQGFAPCVPSSQFAGTCNQVGGSITNRFGPAVCELTRRYDYQSYLELTVYVANQLPIITPGIPTGGLDTGIRIRKGSKLSFFALQSGKWGYFQQSSSSFWGGAISFSWFSGNCQSIDWAGNGSKGELTNEGQPAGLFGSDGVESFYLGNGASRTTVQIHNDGNLRLGINADPSTPFGCTSPGYGIIDLTTCEDTNGNSYNC